MISIRPSPLWKRPSAVLCANRSNTMTRRGKVITAVAVSAILVGVIVLAAFKRGDKAVEVRLEKVQKRDLTAYVTASGQVQPHTKVDVASDVSGRIVKLSVKEGDMVTKGQFLLQIDPS